MEKERVLKELNVLLQETSGQAKAAMTVAIRAVTALPPDHDAFDSWPPRGIVHDPTYG